MLKSKTPLVVWSSLVVLALVATRTARGAPALGAPLAQGQGTIYVLAWLDSVGDGGYPCLGCDGTYSSQDQANARANPIGPMTFSVRELSGNQVGSITTAAQANGQWRGNLDLPINDYEVTLETDVTANNLQLCPDVPGTIRVTRQEFIDAGGAATAEYRFWGGCAIAPTATSPPPTDTPMSPPPAQPTDTPAPGAPTVEPTAGPPGRGPFGTIKGVAFVDANQNGRLDPTERRLAGVRIFLSGGGVQVAKNTEATGVYEFAGLGPGKYDVSVIVGPEWRHTTPQKLTNVEVRGDVVSGVDFGLVEAGARPGRPAVGAPRLMPITGITALNDGQMAGLAAGILLAIGLGGAAFEARIVRAGRDLKRKLRHT